MGFISCVIIMFLDSVPALSRIFPVRGSPVSLFCNTRMFRFVTEAGNCMTDTPSLPTIYNQPEKLIGSHWADQVK